MFFFSGLSVLTVVPLCHRKCRALSHTCQKAWGHTSSGWVGHWGASAEWGTSCRGECARHDMLDILHA